MRNPIDNQTPFACEPLALADEEGRPLLLVVVKATYVLGSGPLRLADEQVPVNIAGEYWGKPDESSYRYEPECALFKPATDVVLVGHAHAAEQNTTSLLVSLKVGTLQKSVRVVGERVWFKSMGSISMTQPLVFEKLPLRYERAFGGWDRSHPEPARHTFEPRNPVGVGFRASPRNFEEELRLPNLEEPDHPVRQFGQVVPPAGFGFISPHWQPRTAFAGTYDDAWRKQRMPRLPKDFDRRYFNAASPGLVAPGYLKGGEPVTVLNASPRPLSFALPTQSPEVKAVLAFAGDSWVEMKLDTCIIDTDIERVMLLWRGSVVLKDGPDDVLELSISTSTPVGLS
ncbi:DUF2169 family type VI secretion system accessory protein [Archangium violaceum]|uniref:DUF2169 domain-containing protein n=1 Tax=Archangium violaceum Cb vi76 TaxID=1406225 RepID=A0A084SRB0_9BACT|nr:DUF2169 domain-containing protein [Archangium violaceum]KFA90995.1 hypothetical protein Q664_25090 [Archangium violaceum Cb vi76]